MVLKEIVLAVVTLFIVSVTVIYLTANSVLPTCESQIIEYQKNKGKSQIPEPKFSALSKCDESIRKKY
jgi:ABC-type dipeptide/oligopeptide/nickel transport system permease component